MKKGQVYGFFWLGMAIFLFLIGVATNFGFDERTVNAIKLCGFLFFLVHLLVWLGIWE